MNLTIVGNVGWAPFSPPCDLFILKREGAEADYTRQEIDSARVLFHDMNPEKRDLITRNIIP